MTKEESPVVFMRASEFKIELQWAREAEREACAKLCDELHLEGEDNTRLAADMIRARGNK